METRYTANVRARWDTTHTFEFDTEEEAEEFIGKVNDGGGDGLDAIIAAGDITSQNGDLVDYSANPMVGTTNG